MTDTVICKTCGAVIENRTKRSNPRQFCDSVCRNKHWNAINQGRVTVEAKPKPIPGSKLTNWERIMQRVDPLTHRYTSEDLPESKVKP
jgi:hypothetical protein